jgi:hypothetical protein
LLLAGAAALTFLVPARAALADSQVATVALLLEADDVEDLQQCLQGAVAIVFAGPGATGTQKTISSDPEFGVFANHALNPLDAQYITRGRVFRGVVRSLGDAFPSGKAMLFDPGSDVVVEFCEYVSDNSNSIEIDPLGAKVLVIVTGTVY